MESYIYLLKLNLMSVELYLVSYVQEDIICMATYICTCGLPENVAALL